MWRLIQVSSGALVLSSQTDQFQYCVFGCFCGKHLLCCSTGGIKNRKKRQLGLCCRNYSWEGFSFEEWAGFMLRGKNTEQVWSRKSGSKQNKENGRDGTLCQQNVVLLDCWFSRVILPTSLIGWERWGPWLCLRGGGGPFTWARAGGPDSAAAASSAVYLPHTTSNYWFWALYADVADRISYQRG